MKDRPIDFSDIPEMTDEQWENAVVMPPMTQFKSMKAWEAYYQKQLKAKKAAAKRKPVSITLEPDVIGWFQSHSKDYQASINHVLKHYILSHTLPR